MRVLFVTPYPPSRIRVRAYGFVRQLARHHQVTVVSPATNEREWSDAASLRREGINIKTVLDRRIHQTMRAVSALGTSTPMQVAFGATPALRDAIARELATGDHDILHVEHLRALGALPRQPTPPLVWDAVDCVSHLFELRGKANSALAFRPLVQLEARRTRAFEWHQLQALHQVVVTCERERQLMLAANTGVSWERLPGHVATVSVVPNGVDLPAGPSDDASRQPATLVFSGKMSYHANIAGIALLVREILPRVWEHRPEVQLVIAGSNPPYSVRQLSHDPRIMVTGFVSDLRPLIVRARIAVSPLPYAVGIQNKILEAMALGTPVIASVAAASGLKAVNGRDLLVAATPTTFAEHIVRLLDDDLQWDSLARHGLEYVRTHHTWDLAGSRLTAVYEQAAEDWTRAGGYSKLQ